jgi:hypothetical protein
LLVKEEESFTPLSLIASNNYVPEKNIQEEKFFKNEVGNNFPGRLIF